MSTYEFYDLELDRRKTQKQITKSRKVRIHEIRLNHFLLLLLLLSLTILCHNFSSVAPLVELDEQTESYSISEHVSVRPDNMRLEKI